jgi:hypothetical protein
MSEASRGPRWRLSVWSQDSTIVTIFEFDAEPEEYPDALEGVASFYGEREGRTVRSFVSIERVAAWSLEEIPR